MSTKIADEGINPDTLDRLCVAMKLVELTAPLSIPEALPIRGLVASTPKSLHLNEGFEQPRAVGVADAPVLRQPAADHSDDTRSKITTLDPGRDQESRVIDDEVQLTWTLFRCPTDEVVSGFCFPGACSEGQRAMI